ncbi:MAG: putative PurR-regulated permease PerM [Pseudohongiellaceae bacterium]|jgi:predicted PurR-regulated permease PerM
MKEVTSRDANGINSKSATGLYHLNSVSPVKCLLALAIVYTLYFAQTLILLILLTALVALLLSPLVSLLKRFFIPRAVSSVILLIMLVMPFSFLSIELAEPAQKWAKLVPKLSVHLTEQIDLFSETFELHEKAEREILKDIEKEQNTGFAFFGWFENEEPAQKVLKTADKNVVTEQLKESSVIVAINLLSAAPMIIAQVLSCLILILFLLIFGPALFEAFIQCLPSSEKKERAMHLVDSIQKELSRYIITVSTINVVLGFATAAALHIVGMEDALLWGALVGLLNFMPYLGAAIGVVILMLASVVQYGLGLGMLIPVGIYLTLNLIESQFITPTILGHRMKINPLVVILWLLICAWFWGVIGVLLAVPLLVCIKLILVQLGVWKNAICIIESGG